jgi:hypothetical protein
MKGNASGIFYKSRQLDPDMHAPPTVAELYENAGIRPAFSLSTTTRSVDIRMKESDVAESLY